MEENYQTKTEALQRTAKTVKEEEKTETKAKTEEKTALEAQKTKTKTKTSLYHASDVETALENSL